MADKEYAARYPTSECLNLLDIRMRVFESPPDIRIAVITTVQVVAVCVPDAVPKGPSSNVAQMWSDPQTQRGSPKGRARLRAPSDAPPPHSFLCLVESGSASSVTRRRWVRVL